VDVLKRYAKLFVERFNRASEEDFSSNVLFNDSKDICSMVQQCMDIDIKGKKLIGRDQRFFSARSTVSAGAESYNFFQLARRRKSEQSSGTSLGTRYSASESHGGFTPSTSRETLQVPEEQDVPSELTHAAPAAGNVMKPQEHSLARETLQVPEEQDVPSELTHADLPPKLTHAADSNVSNEQDECPETTL